MIPAKTPAANPHLLQPLNQPHSRINLIPESTSVPNQPQPQIKLSGADILVGGVDLIVDLQPASPLRPSPHDLPRPPLWLHHPTMDTSGVTIRIALPSETARIAATYAAWNYSGGISPDDTAWLAEIADEWIGLAKIAPEHGIFVLRGMRIATHWQRLGIGTRILTELASWLNTRPCYCLPYTHLSRFYAQIGFVEIPPTDAPAFLSSRLANYKHQGLNVVLMKRSV